MVDLVSYLKTKISIRSFIVFSASLILINNFSNLDAEELRAHPSAIVFNSVAGHSLTYTRPIFLTTATGASINWSQSTNAAWIAPDQNGGATDGILRIGVNTTGLQPGTYNGNVVLDAPAITNGPVVISISLVVNPDVPVSVTPWKENYAGAMSVSVDDSYGSGYDALLANGFSGTYFLEDVDPPAYYPTYYNTGMELGCHTVNHPCFSVTDDRLRNMELVPNISALCSKTPEPCKDVISFAWPCGYTNYREQAISSEYFMSCRGYNINQLEDQYPENFMNLNSYNSHEHTPYPPSDLKTVVDLAVSQKKWFNLVLHSASNDDGATNYAATKNIWVTSIGNIIKYIMQRERIILTNYNTSASNITFQVSRLAVPSSPYRSFETAFGTNDVLTFQIDIDDARTIENVYINGAPNSYKTTSINGNLFLLTNIQPLVGSVKSVEVRYVNNGLINLTISGVTAQNKVYDRTTSAALNTGSATLVGVIAGDNVTLVTTGAIGTFSNKNTGTSKTVTCSGFTLSGADAVKYNLTQPVTTANITPVTLTISGVTANNKVYDRTTSATLNTGSAVLVGVLSGDLVTLVKTGASGTFINKNTGTSKTVTISGFSLSGTDAGNYTLTQPSSAANITAAPLTITGVTANNKVYDGTTSATLNTGSASLSGVIAGDAVTLITTVATGTFENALTGTAKTVYTAGFSITGTDAGNYSLTQPTTTADILGLPLTVSGVTASDKVYNGTTLATLNTASATLTGVLSGDNVILIKTGATGNFNNKNVGNSKPVTTSGFTLSGSDASKYTLTQPVTSANITPAGLTVSGLIASDKVYNGTTQATFSTGSAVLVGVFSGDNVTLVSSGASGTFNNKNAGTSKTVTFTGFTLGGTNAANYTLTQPTATADITPASLSVSGVTANNKIYDGTTTATLNTTGVFLTGVITGDAVSLLSGAVSGTFLTKNAGTARTVTISGFGLNGADAPNYSLVQPAATANITPLVITVSGVIANDKVYNGTTSATLNVAGASLQGVLGGDAVTLVFTGATGTFNNKNTGVSKPVTVSGITLGGSDGGNYTLTQPSGTADITPAPLSVSGTTVNTKVYDKTTAATLNTSSASLTGKFGTDQVTLDTGNAAASFSSENAGTNIPVIVTGFAISGNDAGNYMLSQPALAGTITPKPLTVTANNMSKPYKTTLAFNGDEYTSEGLIAGDMLPAFSLNSPGAQESAIPGDYVITITGGAVINYNVHFINGQLRVEKLQITASADSKTRLYGTENPLFSITYSGFMNGDDVSSLDVLPVASTVAAETSDAGTYPIILAGGFDDKYAIKPVNGVLEVLQAQLTVTPDNKTIVYGESIPELTFSCTGFVLGQDLSALDLLPVVVTDAQENSDAGNYTILASGASAHNYSFVYAPANLIIQKADQTITVNKLPGETRMSEHLQLDATATSNLPVSFKLSDPKKGSLKNNTITFTGDGNLIITAVQEGNKNWNAAEDVAQTIDILPTFDNISSLFTPNADGMNDYWYIPHLDDYGIIEVKVYNRFGQVVYESAGYKNDWDGTWNGYPLPSASYYYIIRSSTKGFLKGVVNIVR